MADGDTSREEPAAVGDPVAVAIVVADQAALDEASG